MVRRGVSGWHETLDLILGANGTLEWVWGVREGGRERGCMYGYGGVS